MGTILSSSILPESFLTSFTTGHYVENIGNTTLTYLEVFNTGALYKNARCSSAHVYHADRFADVSLSQVCLL